MEINLNLDCDINELLRAVGDGLDKIFDRTAITTMDVEGGRFVSAMADGKVLAAFNHPTRRHSATAVGGFGAPQTKSVASPGKWAVAYVNKGLWGCKTFYNVL